MGSIRARLAKLESEADAEDADAAAFPLCDLYREVNGHTGPPLGVRDERSARREAELWEVAREVIAGRGGDPEGDPEAWEAVCDAFAAIDSAPQWSRPCYFSTAVRWWRFERRASADRPMREVALRIALGTDPDDTPLLDALPALGDLDLGPTSLEGLGSPLAALARDAARTIDPDAASDPEGNPVAWDAALLAVAYVDDHIAEHGGRWGRTPIREIELLARVIGASGRLPEYRNY